MKNKKDILKFGLLIVLAVCLITGGISGTFAKYTSKQESIDTVRVAKWSFNVNDKNIVKESFDFSVFGDTDIVAPGDTGEFTLKLENTSEVDAKYSINFDVKNFDVVPVEFYCEADDDWYQDIEPIMDQAIASGASENVVIKWRWNSVSDEQDTLIGSKDVLSTIVVKATVTATQAI